MQLSSVPAFCDYLRRTGDRHAHYYEIADSPYESPLDGPLEFGQQYQIHVVDSFARRRPMLINLDFIRSTSEYRLEAAVTLVLDSQIASGLHSYRGARSGMDSDRRNAFRSLLLYASSRGFDYNPFFYLMESIHRMESQVVLETVSPVATSLLYFHSMDTDHFSKFDEIRLNPDATDYYFKLYGVRTLEDCGRAVVEHFLKGYEQCDFIRILSATYAALLKMTLVHRKERGNFERKFEEFQDFMATHIGCNMAWESHLALCYFAGLVGKFLPVQRTMKVQSAKRALWATAWDLLLLRMPEVLLTPRNLPRINLGYACSADKQLSEIGALFSMMRIIMRSDSETGVGPVLGMDLTAIEGKVGAAAVRAVSDIAARSWPENRPQRVPKPPCKDRLRAIVEDLEVQLSNLCKP